MKLLAPLLLLIVSLQKDICFSFALNAPRNKSIRSVSGGRATASVLTRAQSTKLYNAAVATAVPAGGNTEEMGATIPNEIFNLVKSIVGAGVLSLPAGIALFGNAPSALIPAVALIFAIGSASGYCFSAIGRVCAYLGATSYRDAWAKSVNEETSWIPAVSCTLKTACACLAYSMILADTFKTLINSAGFAAVGRTQTLLGLTSIVLLPLCLLKNLSALAPFSLLGIVGMLYTFVAMALRYVSGAYKLPGGSLISDVAPEMQPVFGDVGAAGVLSPKAFVLIGMLSTAYMAHFNAPKFYLELRNNTIERYNKVVSSSFLISILMFAAITSAGFLTFGAASNGFILNNYSTKDALISLSRVAVAISITFSFPLAFAGLRDGVLDTLNIPMEKRTGSTLTQFTCAILALITFLAMKVKDVAFVLSFFGSTLGNALIYIYPAIMFNGAIKKMGQDKVTDTMKAEGNFFKLLGTLGAGMGVVGAKMALASLSK